LKNNTNREIAMRITDDRYSRDTARMDLAVRLIRLEARTRTIQRWTGLSDDRIRKLYRSYLRDNKSNVRRHRGKSPQRSGVFLGTGRTARHATALAALLSALGAVPPNNNGGRSANKERVVRTMLPGELICDAYEAYCTLLPSREIGFEHAILLATAISTGRELTLSGCRHCAAPVLTDAITIRLPSCERCESVAEAGASPSATATLGSEPNFSPWACSAKDPIHLPDLISTAAPTSAKLPIG
jgi:hypothetical protein